jgi:hypothetical protein
MYRLRFFQFGTAEPMGHFLAPPHQKSKTMTTRRVVPLEELFFPDN